MKRIFDILGAATLLVVFWWLTLIIVLIYLFSGERHIFYISDRIGLNGKKFRMFKFRTLKPAGSTLHDRQFWLGKFLRFTSLDELPQLINVLKGEMSLVGPRPLPVEYLPLFSDEQRIRHRVRPGITGWAQVNGRHQISWEEKFRLDIYYVNHQSMWLDIRILLRTVVLLLSFRRDVSLDEEPLRPHAGPPAGRRSGPARS